MQVINYNYFFAGNSITIIIAHNSLSLTAINMSSCLMSMYHQQGGYVVELVYE